MQNKKDINKRGNLLRLLKMLFKAYPVLLPVTCVCIIFAAITAAMPAVFQQQVLAHIGEWYKSGDWKGAAKVIVPKVTILAVFYVVSLTAIIVHTQLSTLSRACKAKTMPRIKDEEKLRNISHGAHRRYHAVAPITPRPPTAHLYWLRFA